MTRRDFIKTTALAAGAAPCLRADSRALPPAASLDPIEDLSPLAHTHDLRLPDWGSYNNFYNGLAHVGDLKEGVSFEVSVFPGFFRRDVLVPNVKWVSGFHPWEAAPDLSYFSYRYELEWKDQVYCDVSFSKIDARTRLIRAEFVNNTAYWQNVALHYMAYLYYPRVRPYTDEILQRVDVKLPVGGMWMNAVDYADLQFTPPRPTDTLVSAAQCRGEIRDHGFVSGSGIGFAKTAGTKLSFKIDLTESLPDATLVLRYRTKGNTETNLEFTGAVSGAILLPASAEFSVAKTAIGKIESGARELIFVAKGGSPLELDGFALVPANSAHAVKFEEKPLHPIPKISEGPVPQSLLLKYQDVANHYGLAWKHDLSEVREFQNSELDRFFRRNVLNHIQKNFIGDRKGHFTNVFIRPIRLLPNTTRVIYGVATVGDEAEVETVLKETRIDEAQMEAIYEKARKKRFQLAASPKGEPFVFSQEKMAATMLTNVIFPVYAKRSYFRHNSPGKWWDSLYTWDSGFIGLGFTELDLDRAIDCLNAYTTEPGDPQAAFVHIGTPLPVQIFHFWELWNRTGSKHLLEYFYPRLRQYHQFLAGRHGNSTTRRLKSNLLVTWDYFYNTGWDDYPPQKFMHEQKLVRSVAPVITTAHAIRTAKMLRVAAKVLGQDKDVSVYDEDIGRWSEAIQKNCWDEATGYYSYVTHDEEGRAKGILRHPDGQNFNMGMDGVTPMIAGIGERKQFQAQLKNLQSEQHLWTSIGLSTVDQAAAYYRRDGYWNGAVWMPHQWFIWKSLFDWGEGDFAFKIAQTALDLWKYEVDESYHCFEHFLIESRRGAGWHQFSSLSAPVVNWFAAYYVPGHLTTGFDVWTRRCEFSQSNRQLRAQLQIDCQRAGNIHVLATMNPAGKYQLRWAGAPAAFKEILPGVLQIEIPAAAATGWLEIRSA